MADGCLRSAGEKSGLFISIRRVSIWVDPDPLRGREKKGPMQGALEPLLILDVHSTRDDN